jgi:hypothetical protein
VSRPRRGPCRDLDSGLLDAVLDVLKAEFSRLLANHSISLAMSATLPAARLRSKRMKGKIGERDGVKGNSKKGDELGVSPFTGT